MRIVSPGKFVFVAQWLAAFVLPVWFFIGRGLVGAELGWMAVLGVAVFGLPLILILLVPPLITLFDGGVRRARAERFGFSISSIVLWSAIVLAALVVPDSGDSGHLESALTRWTGGAISYAASEGIFAALSAVVVLAYAAALVLGIVGAIRSRSLTEARPA